MNPFVAAMHEVSVVIPTRDRWPVLAASGLRSALSQEGVDLEVVVVDDGSSEERPDGLPGGDDPRVRILRHPESRGAASARNTGIAAARGVWIAFLDDDDLWSPRKLRMQLDLARSTGASLVFAGVAVLDARKAVLHVDRPAPPTVDALLQRNTIPAGSSNVIAETASVREVGGFDERLTYVADWDLWIRLARTGAVAVCPDLLVGYVRQGDGMRFAGRSAIREMQYFVEKHGDTDAAADPARFLRWVASEDRLAGHRMDAVSTYVLSAVAFRRPRHLVHAASTLLDLHRLGSLGSKSERRGTTVEHAPDVPWLARYR